LFEVVDGGFEGASSIENVVYEEHVMVADVKLELLGISEFSGGGGLAVARDSDEIEPEGAGKVADEVGHEKNATVEERYNGDFAWGQLRVQLLAKGLHSVSDLLCREQHPTGLGVVHVLHGAVERSV